MTLLRLHEPSKSLISDLLNDFQTNMASNNKLAGIATIASADENVKLDNCNDC